MKPNYTRIKGCFLPIWQQKNPNNISTEICPKSDLYAWCDVNNTATNSFICSELIHFQIRKVISWCFLICDFVHFFGRFVVFLWCDKTSNHQWKYSIFFKNFLIGWKIGIWTCQMLLANHFEACLAILWICEYDKDFELSKNTDFSAFLFCIVCVWLQQRIMDAII